MKESMIDKKLLTFSSEDFPKPLKISLLVKRVKEALSILINEVVIEDIIIAIDEITTNILEYSLINTLQPEIRFAFKIGVSQINILIEDNGENGYNYQPDNMGACNNLEDLHNQVAVTNRGMGTYLVKQVMDEVTYEPKPGGWNKTILIKKF